MRCGLLNSIHCDKEYGSDSMTPYVLTLVGNTEAEPLAQTHVEKLCDRLNLKCTEVWLAENEACDLFFDSTLSAADISAWARDVMSDSAIDSNCAPVSRRRKKILISDMDSTIINQECIDELGEAIGAGLAIRKITQAVVNGEISFPDALRQRLTLMKGMERELLERVYAQRITLKQGARTLVQTMRHHGAFCSLVSGGFSFFTSRIARKVGFHDHQANELEFEHGKLTGEVIEPILGRSAKLETLKQLCGERDLTPMDVLAVGDGANDIKMISAAGFGVAFHGSDSLKKQSNVHVNHNDLTCLLFMQGYRKCEFATS